MQLSLHCLLGRQVLEHAILVRQGVNESGYGLSTCRLSGREDMNLL